jgi:hypothetical protein
MAAAAPIMIISCKEGFSFSIFYYFFILLYNAKISKNLSFVCLENRIPGNITCFPEKSNVLGKIGIAIGQSLTAWENPQKQGEVFLLFGQIMPRLA